MNILSINTRDISGGAEKVACNLHKSYNERGHQAWLAVGFKHGDDPNTLEIPRNIHSLYTQTLYQFRDYLRVQNRHLPGMWRLSEIVDWLAQPMAKLDRSRGKNLYYPGSRKILKLLPETPDIVHTHNLHGSYFDLRFLPQLSNRIPFVMTLHDEWMFTGHCACTLNCPGWESGCASCQFLTLYPANRGDAIALNWQRKRDIYRRSILYVATPSQWLMERAQRSILEPLEGRVINNGVDLNIYHPEGRSKVRYLLHLPKDGFILLFAASNVKNNPFKDYKTILNTMAHLANADTKGMPITFVALGGEEEKEDSLGPIKIKHIPFRSDPAVVAQYFQAADLYLHATKSDNYPNVILEALACGTPVIATAVGGIPEQIDIGETGFLVPPGDSKAMARQIINLMQNVHLRRQMEINAAETARKRFDLNQQVNAYLAWYEEIIAGWQSLKSKPRPTIQI